MSGEFDPSLDWWVEALETIKWEDERKLVSNYDWILVLAKQKEIDYDRFILTEEDYYNKIGDGIFKYVDYAKPIDWQKRRFKYLDSDWKEELGDIREQINDNEYEQIEKEFLSQTGNSINTNLDQWVEIPDDKDGTIYDPENGFEYEKDPPRGTDRNNRYTNNDYSKKGIFTIFYLAYDYFSLMYVFYYDIFDGMMDLSKYPTIRQNYDPNYTSNAFANLFGTVVIYYGSIIAVGLSMRLYRVYNTIKTL